MSTETNEIDGAPESVKPKTRQEENWLIMTVLQVPWHHANQVDDQSDRDFLVEKALEVQSYLQQEQAKQRDAFVDAMNQQGDSGLITPPSSIITPN